VVGAGENHTPDPELVHRFIQVGDAEDVGVHNRQEGFFGGDAAEVQDRVHALAHLHDRVAVSQVALDHFLAGTGRADVAEVSQAHDVRELVQVLAQAAPEVTGGAGEEDASEWFRHDVGEGRCRKRGLCWKPARR
jgi:hypothetical protein